MAATLLGAAEYMIAIDFGIGSLGFCTSDTAIVEAQRGAFRRIIDNKVQGMSTPPNLNPKKLRRIKGEISFWFGLTSGILGMLGVQLGSGVLKIAAWIIAGLGYVALLWALIYIASNARYSVKLRKLARFGIAMVISLSLITCISIANRTHVEKVARQAQIRKEAEVKEKENAIARSKVIVVVANFVGPDSKKYQVTEEVLAQLRKSLTGYGDCLIRPLNEAITEQQGNEMARVLGMQHQADLVLWGRYGVTGSDVRLTLHVENLTEAKSLPLPIAKDYATQAVVAELERFQFQERFSKEMSALVLFISGVVRYEAGDYPGAIRRLDSALAAGRWPKGLVAKAALFFYRGNCYLSAGNIQQSMADLTKAIQLAPHYAEAYVNRGYLYNILSKYSKAITDLTYAVHLEPKLVEAYINRGITYAFLRQPYKSIADYTHAIQLDPESKRPFNNRGAIYISLGEYQKAIADFSQAIRIDPQYVNAYNNRAITYRAMGEYQMAIADLTQAIQINPQDAPSYYNRGHTYLALGEMQKAVKDSSTAISLNPKDADAYNNRAIAYDTLGEFNEAIVDYSKAIRLIPKNAKYYYNRAHTYLKLRKYKQALLDDSQAIRLDPKLAEAYNDRGIAYLFLGKMPQAIAEYSHAIQINPKLDKAYNNRADAYKLSGEKRKAIADYRKVVEISGNPILIKYAKEELDKLH